MPPLAVPRSRWFCFFLLLDRVWYWFWSSRVVVVLFLFNVGSRLVLGLVLRVGRSACAVVLCHWFLSSAPRVGGPCQNQAKKWKVRVVN